MDWLRDVNSKMGSQHKKILMLIDNCSGHNTAEEMHLSNVKIMFLPKNTTSIMQPMDMGIIMAVKRHFKVQMARALIMELDKNAKTPMLAKKQLSCMQSGLEWSDTEH